MRNQTCYDNEMEDKRRISVKRIIEKYPEVLDGFDSWDCGFWNGVLGTLRWVLDEEEKDMLDT